MDRHWPEVPGGVDDTAWSAIVEVLEARLKTLELIEPFRIAHGQSRSRTVLRLFDGGREVEAPFVPYYGESPEQVLSMFEQLPLPAAYRGAGTLAMDLFECESLCLEESKPLWTLASASLGERRERNVPACRSFSIPTDLQTFAKRVRACHEQFQVLKLKLGSGDGDWDVQIVRAARKAAPGASLLLDVNGGWSPEEAPGMVGKLREFGPVLVEQPFHHSEAVDAWSRLRDQLPEDAPLIFADESAQTADDFACLAGAVDGVNIKLLKCGGFRPAVQAFAAARRLGLQVLLGCMIESSLGTTAAAHLAGWADWVDLDGHLYVANDDYTGVQFGGDGHLVLPSGPGIAAQPRSV